MYGTCFDLDFRIEDEMTESAGNPEINGCPDLSTLGLLTPLHKCKHPIKELESRK